MASSPTTLSYFFALLLLLATLLLIFTPCSCSIYFNVDSFGASANGQHDDTKAFMNAWNAACRAGGSPTFYVPPSKTYVVGPMTFSGPCKDRIVVKIQGHIVAPGNIKAWSSVHDGRYWLRFSNLMGLSIVGGGTIFGNGHHWWNCKKANICSVAPTALTISDSKGVTLQNLHFVDSQQIHVHIENSRNVLVTGLSIQAPALSPNTDGIHISESSYVTVSSSSISTGDDCVSIVSGSSYISVNDIECGPGHGISIGSLGKAGEKAWVSDVNINQVHLSGTTNGLRIKTWQGGIGIAQNIHFNNVIMKNVDNPIIIDQFYCDSESSGSCGTKNSGVKIRGVSYYNIKGTSASNVAIKLDCSDTVACSGISFKKINIVKSDSSPAKVECNNVHGYMIGSLTPHLNCLES